MYPLLSINEKINFSVSVKFVDPSFVYDIEVILSPLLKSLLSGLADNVIPCFTIGTMNPDQ